MAIYNNRLICLWISKMLSRIIIMQTKEWCNKILVLTIKIWTKCNLVNRHPKAKTLDFNPKTMITIITKENHLCIRTKCNYKISINQEFFNLCFSTTKILEKLCGLTMWIYNKYTSQSLPMLALVNKPIT